MSSGRILVVDDEADIRGLLEEILSEEGHEVEAAGSAAEARKLYETSQPDLVLLDIWMPDVDGITLLREWSAGEGRRPCPVVMMSGHGTVETAVEATRLGAFDFIEKPVSLAKLLRTVERALETGRAAGRSSRSMVAAAASVPVGRSRIIQALRENAERMAAHDTPVLVTGEPGSGRESFARFIHSQGPRAGEPFVRLVASALPDEGAEAALFGRFTDGRLEPGFFSRARSGTLFIKELSDLGTEAQRLLIGALENGRFTPLGGSGQPLETRIIASVKPGFERGLQGGVFRQELLTHLGVVVLKVPPLREYAEDVPELLRHYLDKLVDNQGLPFRRFSVAAQNRLRNYPWPGNVAELRNMVHRLLILGGEEEISLEEVEQIIADTVPAGESLLSQDLMALPLREAREQFERAYLQQQLQICEGKVGQLAKRVGMERTHLYRKLRTLGIDFGSGGTDD